MKYFGRQLPSEQRQKPHDNTEIVRLLCSLLQQSHSVIQDIMLLIRTTNEVKEEIEKSLPQILDILQEINQWDVQICSWQFKRQSELWKVIDALSDKIRNLQLSSSPVYLSSSPKTPSPGKYSTVGRPIFSRYYGDSNLRGSFPIASMKNMSPSLVPDLQTKIEPLKSGSAYLDDNSEKNKLATSLQSFVPDSYVSVLNKEEANRVIKENEELSECLQEMVNQLKSDQQISHSPKTNGHETDFKEVNKKM